MNSKSTYNSELPKDIQAKHQIWNDLISNKCFIALNLGSGDTVLNNFINIDISDHSNVNIQHDLTKGLPFITENSVDMIYSEHFVEHISRNDSLILMNECFRVLKPNHRIRVATHDLEYIIYKYLFDWQSQSWLSKKTLPSNFIKTKCNIFNVSLRNWGHQYIYDEDDLSLVLSEAGFLDISRQYFGISSDKNLWDLETRIDSTLILEGLKPKIILD